MAFYSENFIICRVTLRVLRSLSYFEQKIESTFAEISYCRVAGLPNRTTVLKVVMVGDVVSDWVAALHICSLPLLERKMRIFSAHNSGNCRRPRSKHETHPAESEEATK